MDHLFGFVSSLVGGLEVLRELLGSFCKAVKCIVHLLSRPERLLQPSERCRYLLHPVKRYKLIDEADFTIEESISYLYKGAAAISSIVFYE